MSNEWKVNKQETIIESDYVTLLKEDVSLPNGTHIEDFYKVKIKDCCAIVALDKNNNIILKKEYRHCYRRELIEVPAGCIEKGETDPLEVAKRELREETGYVSDYWTYLGATVESSAKLTNYMHIYLAKDCIKAFDQSLDETEIVDVIVVPLQKAIDMCMDNTICCNSSVNGILKVARMLGK